MQAREPEPVGEELAELYAGKQRVAELRAEISTRAFDEALTGQPRVEGGVLLDPPGKETSPEIASLASRYISMPTEHFVGLDAVEAEIVAANVRRIAAAALTQAKRKAP